MIAVGDLVTITNPKLLGYQHIGTVIAFNEDKESKNAKVMFDFPLYNEGSMGGPRYSFWFRQGNIKKLNNSEAVMLRLKGR